MEKITDGEQDSTWGTAERANQDKLDDAIADDLVKSVAGASDVTLTAAEAIHAQHYYTGVLTGNINVIVPAAEKIFHISNDTTGSFTLTVKTSAGTGVLIPQGAKSIVICDGTNVLNWLTHLLGAKFFLDADNDSYFHADTDDRLDIGLNDVDLFRFDGTVASPVNGFDFVAAATGNASEIQAAGSDTDIAIKVVSKAAANVEFFAGALELLKLAYVASAVNFNQLEPSITGSPVKWAAFGDDANIGNAIQPKGTGPLDLLTGAFNENKGADIASATTTDIGAATGNLVDISGTTTITGLGTVKAGTQRVLQFDGILVLTHHATSLILQGGANITTAAGDIAKLTSLGSGNWICTGYMRAASATALSGERIEQTKLDTEQATTSGTAWNFTSPFATTTRIIVMFDGFSTDGTEETIVQLGDAGGLETTGYVGQVGFDGGTAYAGSGFAMIGAGAAGDLLTGALTLTLMDASNNTWIGSHIIAEPSSAAEYGSGDKSLSATLTTLRVTTTGTPDDGDAGAVNVRWYGY